jgi:hypothetical protein
MSPGQAYSCARKAHLSRNFRIGGRREARDESLAAQVPSKRQRREHVVLVVIDQLGPGPLVPRPGSSNPL